MTSAEGSRRHAFTEQERSRGSRVSAERRRRLAQREAAERREWMAEERRLYLAYQDAQATGGLEAHDARHAWSQHLGRMPGSSR